MGHAEAGRVGTQTEKGGLGQIHLTEVTHRDIEADQQDPVDGQQGQQTQDVAVVHHQGNRGKQGQRCQFGATNQ